MCEEWAKAKRLIKTLYDSGAVRLLWQLNEYISSDPRLSEPVRGERVRLDNYVFLSSEEAEAIARDDEKAKYFIGDMREDNTKFQPYNPKWGDSFPNARSALLYNFKEVEVREGDKLIPSVEYSLLVAKCIEEGIVDLGSWYNFPESNEYRVLHTITVPNASRDTEAVYKALGKLYDERPALPYNLRRSI
jgi:hypothetical protein